ncbi:MAG: putative selenate reductase subunit YgfK [Calditrichaeota bacterium]|nr:MAG: putative selenate reductase subunit YgfK [Calditrichota bacterium]MBL1204727.1 putative selenate reductase subunit YgfK [Calditrichota bacterium]NOG44555.1 putative selenate reductase subunit YgfK [Calditrichota bacterium]
MSDKMKPIPFINLLKWIFDEYKNSNSIFGIHSSQFFRKQNKQILSIFDEQIETPVGPAAGPHTQLSQNIITAYLVGSRFFELKTVQKLDQLEINKPCIDAQDECYNIEWSQELRLEESYDEYLKAWILIHLLKDIFDLCGNSDKSFVFNMSVGYDLEGIKTKPMDLFIEQLKDASLSGNFDHYKKEALDFLNSNSGFLTTFVNTEKLNEISNRISNLSPHISHSVTLSTMHGCPPEDIEAIAKYLLKEKKLHTYIKLNPTLLGFEKVRSMLDELGFDYIEMEKSSFDHDLQYHDAVPMIKRLSNLADQENRNFGIKLSNTLGTLNKKQKLNDDQMYMSGRSLFPLTINLAKKLAEEFEGKIKISYSGGADQSNITEIFKAGIFPITLVTDLLKPGGYQRLLPMARTLEELDFGKNTGSIDTIALERLADSSLKNKAYIKESRKIESIKVPEKLEKYDCYMAPCQQACPIHQDVAAYIRLVEEERYEEAFETIIARNPLPYITGYICDHQCQNHCTRWDYDSPVLIRDLKKEAAVKGWSSYLKKFKQNHDAAKNNISVAVIGAGPSGLAFSYFMAKAGFDVTVYEKTDRAGGVVQHALPDFRLPQTAIEKDLEFIKEHGVKFKFGVDAQFSIKKLQQDYNFIYIAIGAGKSNKLAIDGTNGNLFDAINFLQAFNSKAAPKLGEHVAVVGGGNSAMDAARAAKRTAGVKKVYILYRRTEKEMPADREEFDGALKDGVKYEELVLPVSYNKNTLRCQKMQLGEAGSDGRRKVEPIKNDFIDLEINSVISAIGEYVDSDLLISNKIPVNEKSDPLFNPETNQTGLENIYIGGDALRGPATVVEAIADGKKAAEAIIKKALNKATKQPSFKHLFDPQKRKSEITQKKALLNQVQSNKTEEASRCLGCSFVCDKCVDVCPNRANITLNSDLIDGDFDSSGQILHMDGMCNECGNCETFCPYNGSPYKDKVTLFWDEPSFSSSTNDGFLFLDASKSSQEKIRLKVRLDGKVNLLEVARDGFDLPNEKEEENDFNQLLRFAKTVYQNYNYLKM